MKNKLVFFLALIGLQIFLSTMIQFIAWPEMIYEPYLMNHGYTIYKNITIAHAPLLLFVLQSVFKFFINPINALTIFTLFLGLTTGLATYSIAGKIWNDKRIAFLAWTVYILLFFYFQGNGVWFDHLVALLSLISFYFFYQFLFKKKSWQNIFVSGLFLGLAGISKQTAGWLTIPAFFGFCLHLKEKKELIFAIRFGLIFSLGCILPWLGVTGWLVYKQALADFWFWAFKFGIIILPQSSGQILLPSLKQIVGSGMPFLVLLPFLFKARLSLAKKLFITLWCCFAAFGVYPRFEKFHLQPALPLLSMVWAWVLIKKVTLKYSLLIGLTFIFLWVRFLINSWNQPVRFWEKDVQAAVVWLRQNIKPDQPIYVFNTWDHFYALIDRQAAVDPVPPTLEWYLELPGLQEKLIESLKKNKETVVIMEEYKESGLGSYRPEELDKYIRDNFEIETVIGGKFIILERKSERK